MNQTYSGWELIIINDGSTDETEENIEEFLLDERVTYIYNKKNKGLGAALNQGLEASKYNHIAYLPSDDFYYPNHLEYMNNKYKIYKDAALVFSGMSFEFNDSLYSSSETKTIGQKCGFPLQLVQTTHIKTEDRWVERSEFLTDDLFAMFWNKLTDKGNFYNNRSITAHWTQHPFQRHKLLNERFGGGINKARSFYKLNECVRLRISKEKTWDESFTYSSFHKQRNNDNNGLKILIVGELAYNPERICALEKAGHKLYGLWMPEPEININTIGPLPFGHVIDVQHDSWVEDIKQIKPDIIYGLLNTSAIKWVYKVVKEFPEIPFAWHFKEGPQYAIRCGLWNKLIYLYKHANIKIYINEINKKWFELFFPHKGGTSLIIDGDLPIADHFKSCFSRKLSHNDGEIHTIIAGRIIGLSDLEVQQLIAAKIHLHVYSENCSTASRKLLNYYQNRYPAYFHIHSHVPPSRWTEEFSKYDAGWMHIIHSHNGGNLLNASWDDLNTPARLSTYIAAGIPVICYDNSSNSVGMDSIIDKYGIGIKYRTIEELRMKLSNKKEIEVLGQNIRKHRLKFTFDYYIPMLTESFINLLTKNK